MDPNDVHFLDIERILFGTAPAQFLIEAFVRTILMYLLLYACLRLMGKRMNGVVSPIELGIMLALGGIVSVPMEMPERGVAPAAVLLFLTLLFQVSVNYFCLSNERVRHIVQGRARLLVKDGVMQPKELSAAGISFGLLCAHLRERNVSQLGQVERVYLETTGDLSVFLYRDPRPGLSVMPKSEAAPADEAAPHCACTHCGFTTQEIRLPATAVSCPECHHRRWDSAVTPQRECSNVSH